MKAKLRRLCEDKAKAGGSPKYQVPKWLHDEWKSRDHLEMALEFKECGFDKDVNIGIHPEKKIVFQSCTEKWICFEQL